MDRRSSKPEVLTELRQRAVKLKKMGKTHREIAEILEIGESTSRLYWARFKKQGDEGLKLGSRRVCSRTAESIEKPNEIKPEATRFDRLAVSGAIRRLCKMR